LNFNKEVRNESKTKKTKRRLQKKPKCYRHLDGKKISRDGQSGNFGKQIL